MKFKIIWDTNYQYQGARNDPGDPRPTEIEADRSELMYAEGQTGGYPIGLRFVKGDVAVATLFQLPIAAVAVAD